MTPEVLAKKCRFQGSIPLVSNKSSRVRARSALKYPQQVVLPFEKHPPNSAPGRRGSRTNFTSQGRVGDRSQYYFAKKKKKARLSPLWRLQEAQPLKGTIFHTEEHFSPFWNGGNLPLVLVPPSATPHLLSSRAAHSLRVSCKISFLTTATPARKRGMCTCDAEIVPQAKHPGGRAGQGDHAGRGTQASRLAEDRPGCCPRGPWRNFGVAPR